MSAIPAPLFALVGATDAVTAKARTLPERLAEIEIRRFERPTVDVTVLDPRKVTLHKIDLSRIDPRKVELSKVELPKVDVSEVASSAFELAAKAERAYEDFVTRGEQVVARVRGRDTTTTPVATPAKAQASATKKATKPATRATKPATKPSAPPTSATDAE